MAYAKVASLGASGAWGKHDVGFKRGGRKEKSHGRKKKQKNTKLALKDQQPQLLLCVAYFVFWYV